MIKVFAMTDGHHVSPFYFGCYAHMYTSTRTQFQKPREKKINFCLSQFLKAKNLKRKGLFSNHEFDGFCQF